MKFMLFVLPTIPGTFEERRNLRPIGRNNERYQQMLEELRKLVVLAEQAGFDVFSTTEHHFHSETKGSCHGMSRNGSLSPSPRRSCLTSANIRLQDSARGAGRDHILNQYIVSSAFVPSFNVTSASSNTIP